MGENKCIEDCMNYNFDMTYAECVSACKAGGKRASLIIKEGKIKGGDIKIRGHIENTGDVTLDAVHIVLKDKSGEIGIEPDFHTWIIKRGHAKNFKMSTHWNPFSSVREGGNVTLCVMSGTKQIAHRYIRLDLDEDPNRVTETLINTGARVIDGVKATTDTIVEKATPKPCAWYDVICHIEKLGYKVIFAVIVVIALLVALGYSGLGGAAGKAAEKRV